MKKIEHLFVNWVDGMKISRHHFIAEEQAARDHLRDALMLGLSDQHYGLLEPADVVVDEHEVRLNACRAVCRDGSRIELLPHQERHVACDLRPWLTGEHEGRSLYLLAILQADHREGVGAFIEEPARKPVVAPRVCLQFVPLEELNVAAMRSAMVPVACFTVRQGRPVLTAEFVPPCLTVDGFALAERVRRELKATIDTIVDHSGTLLAGLYVKERQLQERAPNRCYAHLAIHSQHALPAVQAAATVGIERPFELVRMVAQLAFAIDAIWRTMPERAALMEYLERKSDWAPLIREQNSAIKELVQQHYTHWDLGGTLTTCLRFLARTREVYRLLREPDLRETWTFPNELAPKTAESFLQPTPPPPVAPVLVRTKKQ